MKPHVQFLVGMAIGVVAPLIGMLLLSGFILVSSMSYEDEVAEAKKYCDMVEKGLWPDYNQNFKEMCVNERSKEE